MAAAHRVRCHRGQLGRRVLQPSRRRVRGPDRRGGAVLPGARRTAVTSPSTCSRRRSPTPSASRGRTRTTPTTRCSTRSTTAPSAEPGHSDAGACSGAPGRSLSCRAHPHPVAARRGVRRRDPRRRRRAAAARRQPGRCGGVVRGRRAPVRVGDMTVTVEAGHGAAGRRAGRRRDRRRRRRRGRRRRSASSCPDGAARRMPPPATTAVRRPCSCSRARSRSASATTPGRAGCCCTSAATSGCAGTWRRTDPQPLP